MIEIPAAFGQPYHLARDERGLIRLRRKVASGRTLTVVFSAADVHNVCDAMVDLVETTA